MCEPHHLADASIAGEYVGVLLDGQAGGGGGGDLQHTAPLSEVSTVLLILGTALIQAVQTWSATADSRDQQTITARCTSQLHAFGS